MIIKKRKLYIESIKSSFKELFKNIVSSEIITEPIYLSNLSDTPTIEEYSQEQSRYHSNEIDSGLSLFGPHREDIGFFWQDHSFKDYASLGQIRISGIILKLVQIMYLKEIKKTEPILLFDDIFYELDPFHKNNVKNIILERFGNMQVFECVNDRDQKMTDDSQVIDLEQKKI